MQGRIWFVSLNWWNRFIKFSNNFIVKQTATPGDLSMKTWLHESNSTHYFQFLADLRPMPYCYEGCNGPCISFYKCSQVYITLHSLWTLDITHRSLAKIIVSIMVQFQGFQISLSLLQTPVSYTQSQSNESVLSKFNFLWLIFCVTSTSPSSTPKEQAGILG